MRGFCSKCGRTFGDQMLCPNCGIQLEADAGTGTAVPLSVPFTDDTPDGPSFPRRLAFGLITLFGLYHGLKHLALAAVLVQTGVPHLPADTYLSLLITATLAASIAAGTVNRRAEATGLILAVASAGGFLGPDLYWGNPLPEEWLVGVPTLMVLIAVVGGFAGRMMVPPAPNLPTFGRLDSRAVVRVRTKRARVVWPQVVFGVAIAVAGVVYADSVRQALSTALRTGGTFGARSLVAWQVSALAALAGGLAAGFGSRAGFRQAVYAGLGAGVGTVLGVLSQQAMNPSPVVDFWVDQLSPRGGGVALPVAAIGATTCVATTLGAWLGSHVFPPADRK
jgi:hypothetical protein